MPPSLFPAHTAPAKLTALGKPSHSGKRPDLLSRCFTNIGLFDLSALSHSGSSHLCVRRNALSPPVLLHFTNTPSAGFSGELPRQKIFRQESDHESRFASWKKDRALRTDAFSDPKNELYSLQKALEERTVARRALFSARSALS